MAERTYTKVYTDFRGVDFSSERSQCDPRRFTDLVNMWRDYRSEHGVAVETSPGFRKLVDVYQEGRVVGMHFVPADDENSVGFLVVNRNDGTVGVTNPTYDNILSMYRLRKGAQHELEATIGGIKRHHFETARKTNSVFHQNSLYTVDGVRFQRIRFSDGEAKITNCEEDAYVPTTYLNGEPFEQKNILTDAFVEKYTDTTQASFVLHEKVPAYDTRPLYAAARGSGVLCERFCTAKDGEERENAPPLKGNGWFLYFDESNNEVYNEIIFPEKRIEVGHSVDIKTGKILFVPEGEEFKESDEEIAKFAILDWYYYEEGSGETLEYHPVVPINEDRASEMGLNFFWKIEDEYIVSLEAKIDPKSEIEIHGFSEPRSFQTVEGVMDAVSGIETLSSGSTSTLDAVNGCTLIIEFDDRVFLSGNPKLPNTVFYSQRDSTGYNNPFYIGCYNYLNDGTGKTPITAMMATATHLIVMKDEGEAGSTIYYHSAVYNTANSKISRDLQPRIYPREEGARGLGCVGCATNFRDDPVFLSSMGLEAVGKSQVNLERTVTHRSSFVDARLRNEDLRNACMAEWEGYLVILVPGGRLYLADSRQVSNVQGSAQYEWYFWDNVGVYKHTSDNPIKERYRYLTSRVADVPHSVDINTSAGIVTYKRGLRGTEEYVPDDLKIYTSGKAHYVLQEIDGGRYVFPVYPTGEMIGGKFCEATSLLVVGDCLLFGCSDGSICVFNTDLRDDSHKMPPDTYIHVNRRYLSGCATNSDNLGRINLSKTTVRRSMVVKTKSFPYSLVAVGAETNLSPMHEVDKIYAGYSDFAHTGYDAFSFNTSDDCHAIVREGERRWIEKRLSFSTECYQSPFGLISVTYDYRVAGKAKMR